MTIEVGDRLARSFTLTPAEISEFARLSGDPNPLHHDQTYARASRFGGIIVSGPQLISLLLGILPAQLLDRGLDVLGLEFSFRFVKGAPANEELELEWRVLGKEPKERLGGEILDLEGGVRSAAGDVFLTATGKALAMPRA